MRIPADLHPADAQLRASLIGQLRASRYTQGIRRKDVADFLGIASPGVLAYEERTTWEARTIARYARAIGWRIEWVIADLELPDDGDVMAAVLAAGDMSTPEREDRARWRALCNDLVRIRRVTCTAVDMAARLGVHENTVHYWEANPDGSSVTAAQRHARALGGHLSWILYYVGTPISRATPAPREAT